MTVRAPLLIDISRTASRLGTGSITGIDRVERAYIDYALDKTEEPYFLTRVLSGLALLDASRMRALLAMERDGLPRAPDFLGRLSRRQSQARRIAETAVRRLCLTWGPVGRLPRIFGRHLAPGFWYINTGHLNITAGVLCGLRAAGADRIGVMIHDTIPLDHPEFSRPVATERFATMLADAAAHADLLICNSNHTLTRLEDRLGRPAPTLLAAPLGVTPPRVVSTAAPEDQPYFVTLGTIEPRKNHALLLSVWQRFHAEIGPERTPHLHIIGKRGWENNKVFALLDNAPFMGQSVFEHGALGDAEAAQMIAGARALLFPSYAEGFGYPLFEALGLGTPVIASDLPVFRELVPEGPIYLEPAATDAWAHAISAHARSGERFVPGVSSVPLPTWADHFGRVFAGLESLPNGKRG